MHQPTLDDQPQPTRTPKVKAAQQPRKVRGGAVPPLLKWPGGKTGELPQIHAAMPSSYDRLIEPFLGGGAVFFSLPAGTASVLNDVSPDLMNFYKLVQSTDAAFFEQLWALEKSWSAMEAWLDMESKPLLDLWETRSTSDEMLKAVTPVVKASADDAVASTLPECISYLAGQTRSWIVAGVPKKIARMRKVELDRGVELPRADVVANIEGAYKAAIYTAVRSIYNANAVGKIRDELQAALFFFLREYAYAAMFRFNASGEFNVPYGGVSYNRKDLASKITHLQSPAVQARLAAASFTCEDFEVALTKASLTAADFLFLDPPYDSDFSGYDQNDFGLADQKRLAGLLSATPAQFMLVIKATPFIENLYAGRGFEIIAFDKKYMWTIKERNNRDATHLLITNYKPPLPRDLTLL